VLIFYTNHCILKKIKKEVITLSENQERLTAEKNTNEIHEEFRLALTDLLSDAYAIEHYAEEEQKEDALYSPAVTKEYRQRLEDFLAQHTQDVLMLGTRLLHCAKRAEKPGT